MEQETDSSQFVPGSLVSLRRTSTGSLNSLKRTTSSHLHDCSTCSTYQSLNSRCRHTPIAGGSWDDNSVGHGSVAARMRRERNRVIRQTKSNTPYVTHTKDTHANITSTLNLINTTSLSPWKRQDEKVPWDDCYDLSDDFVYPQSAASKRTAGSLCNIPSTGSSHLWDSCSVPDYSKTRSIHRKSYRHSYTSANYHSSPTSGCASMAGSDIDSTDLAFFSMTDDSSLIDADSLFSDSFGVLDTSSEFSTNILSLLEEGTISCRTPFLNGDWPDSISELDFDCSEQQNEVSNCDAHSDIGPSCSVPTERNRLKKRQNRAQTDETPKSSQISNGSCDVVAPQVSIDLPECGGSHGNMPSTVPLTAEMPPTEDIMPVEVDLLPPIHCCPSYIPENAVDVDSFITPVQTVLLMTSTDKETIAESRCSSRPEKRPAGVIPPMPSLKSLSPEPVVTAMQLDEDFDSHTVVNCDMNFTDAEPVDIALTSNLDNWNSLPKEEKLGFVEQLSERISKTMGLQEQLDIIQIIGANDKCQIPFRMSIDDIDSHKLSRVLGYLDTHKSADSPSKLDAQKPAQESTLRRSNSDGNIAKSLSEAQKEQRRRQRQARRFAKWLKQRQRKESRQHLKEQRSGLFVNEKKVKIQVENESEEEVEIDI